MGKESRRVFVASLGPGRKNNTREKGHSPSFAGKGEASLDRGSPMALGHGRRPREDDDGAGYPNWYVRTAGPGPLTFSASMLGCLSVPFSALSVLFVLKNASGSVVDGGVHGVGQRGKFGRNTGAVIPGLHAGPNRCPPAPTQSGHRGAREWVAWQTADGVGPLRASC